MVRFVVYLVVLLLLLYLAHRTGGLAYTYAPESLSPSLRQDIWIFLTAFLVLLAISILVSWGAAWVIISLGKGSSHHHIHIGVETEVNLSWAWGFLCGGAVLVCFMIYVVLAFGIPASRWWQALGVFLPHLLAVLSLLLLSLHKARQS